MTSTHNYVQLLDGCPEPRKSNYANVNAIATMHHVQYAIKRLHADDKVA